MARTAAATRRRILESAYELFYRQGFARVGVDAVAERAGLTKRTLYYHFRSKDALLAAVLEFHHEMALARIGRWSARLSGSVEAMIDALFADLADWAARPRWAGAGFTRLVMELADLPGHPARAIARRHKAAVERWLASELARRGVADAAERARDIALLLEGSMTLLLIHGDRAYAEAAARAAKRLVAPAAPKRRRAAKAA
jgi:AcrR family transcriptional regulator